jgi:hypothetical protein
MTAVNQIRQEIATMKAMVVQVRNIRQKADSITVLELAQCWLYAVSAAIENGIAQTRALGRKVDPRTKD